MDVTPVLLAQHNASEHDFHHMDSFDGKSRSLSQLGSRDRDEYIVTARCWIAQKHLTSTSLGQTLRNTLSLLKSQLKWLLANTIRFDSITSDESKLYSRHKIPVFRW